LAMNVPLTEAGLISITARIKVLRFSLICS